MWKIRLAQEIQMEAQELVRRADRGIGQAVRNGQEAGTVNSNGGYRHSSRGNSDQKASPDNYITPGRAQTDTYAMTDGVTDEDFDAALAEARAEGNLSRANMVRK